jgi:opacity protein-like surface antigen
MKRSTLVVAALALTAAGASTAHAQSAAAAAASPVHFGLSAGATLPMSDAIKGVDGEAGMSSKTGYNLTGLLEWRTSMVPFGLRGELMYHDMRGETLSFSDPDFGSVSARPDVRLLAGTLNAILQSTAAMSVKPYGIAGVGVYNTRTKVSGSGDFGGSVFSGSSSQSGTNFGLNGGLGVRFGLSGLDTFVEARYHYVFNKQTCDINSDDVCFDRDNTSFIPVSFGIMF